MAGKVSSDPNVFLLPDLGEGLEEAELIEWCVTEGQTISEFDMLAKMETDKALSDVPSPRGGTIATLHGKPGEKIKVGAPLVTFKPDGDAPAAAKPQPAEQKSLQQSMNQAAPAAAKGSQPQQDEDREDAGTVVGTVQAGGMFEAAPGKVIATPAVRRVARDLGVDLTRISGTGIGGRVVEADVRAFADRGGGGGGGGGGAGGGSGGNGSHDSAAAEPPPSARPPMRESRPAAPRPDSQPLGAPGSTQRIPFRGIRRTIAERLRQSINAAVHFYVMDEVDVSALDEQRRRLMNASGEKLTLLPFVAAAICRVLSGRCGATFNRLNSTVDDAAQEIVQHRSVHLGIAVDTDNGLMVPVIKDADKLGVLEMQRRINSLARSARDRSIPRDQLIGSTFTISNVGSLAGRFATPIINYPEAGILAVGRAREGVVVRDGMIGIGKLLPLSLAADHRVVDGALAASALAKVIELLSVPESLMPAK